MNKIFIILFAVFHLLCSVSYGQNANSIFDKSIELSDYFYQNADFEKALFHAEQANAQARNEKDDRKTGIALNRQAKAIFQMPKRILGSRAKAAKLLRQSLELNDNSALQQNNLKILRNIALARKKLKEVANIDAALEKLKLGEDPLTVLENNGLFGKKRKAALDKVREIKEENQEIIAEKAEIIAEKEEIIAEKEEIEEANEALNDQLDALARERAKLANVSEDLEAMLEDREDAIVEMNEEQIKIQLMLLEQKHLVDSMSFTSLIDSMHLANQSIKNAELKTELSLQESQRNFLIALAVMVGLIAFGMYHRYMSIRKNNKILEEKNHIIQEERNRSEDLLLNILPKIVADELKSKGFAQAERFERATVLFSDFKNFSQIAAHISPEQLVRDLDECFKAFDNIIERHGLEKIKTIGDAYMCAGGIPKGSHSTAKDVVLAAMDIQFFLESWNQKRAEGKLPLFEARIGIHTGPIVAGVVGKKKFAYDIWGDTVNVAARMEQSGEAQKVNVSATTFALLQNDFHFISRGKVPAKNFGEIEMYFVE